MSKQTLIGADQGPTLYAQIKAGLSALGSELPESERMRLHFTPGMLPLNGSVEVAGRITHDFFCVADGGVFVAVAE